MWWAFLFIASLIYRRQKKIEELTRIECSTNRLFKLKQDLIWFFVCVCFSLYRYVIVHIQQFTNCCISALTLLDFIGSGGE